MKVIVICSEYFTLDEIFIWKQEWLLHASDIFNLILNYVYTLERCFVGMCLPTRCLAMGIYVTIY
jgi:hypothetical protein